MNERPLLTPEAELEAWCNGPCEVCDGTGELHLPEDSIEHKLTRWLGLRLAPVPCPYCTPPDALSLS